MVSQTLSPENTEERIVWRAMSATYPLYFIGALYISGPVIGWVLFGLLIGRSMLLSVPNKPVPAPIIVWLFGMALMLLALIIGHLNFDLGSAKTIKSSIGWAKGWGLLALFILIGTMNIRPELIYRAAMRICLHTLMIFPLFLLAWLLRLPETLYVSPLSAVGGPGPEFFAVSLYELDPQSGTPRWRLFTPWAPALGFVANIFFIFALAEKDKKWQRIGFCGSILMVLVSQSRLAALSILAITCLWFALQYIKATTLLFLLSAAAFIVAFFGTQMLSFNESFWEAFDAARADSSRVRKALARIAIDRWQFEAPVWGHGIVERGPHLVEYMPIGSHHTWYGLLFVKGIVGLIALALPMLFSLLALFIIIKNNRTARTAFCCLSLLLFYTLGENLEILAYLIWPALIIIGTAHTSTGSTSSATQIPQDSSMSPASTTLASPQHI